MVAEVIRERISSPEFHPFTLVLANGERLHVRYRDSVAWPSTMLGNRRVYSPYIVVVQAADDSVVTRSVSVPLISQVIDEHTLNGGG